MKIILIGFMCSGKTTIASLLGKQLSLAVIETDELVKEMAGKTTDEIFKQEGEVKYRAYEIAVAKNLKDIDNIIISTGGGVVMNKIIFDYLQKESITIFLETSFEILLKRLDPKIPRPLFQHIEQAKKLYNFRYPIYQDYADIIIKTDCKTPEVLSNEIIEKIKNI